MNVLLRGGNDTLQRSLIRALTGEGHKVHATFSDRDSAGRPAHLELELVVDADGLKSTFRAPHVYGITHDPITLFLIMMRSLPAVPLLSDAYVLRPLWHEDLAAIVGASLKRDLAERPSIVRVAGAEAVTHQELYDRIAALTDRRPLRLPIPEFLASYGARLTEAMHLSAPVEASQLSVARDDEDGWRLPDDFGVVATTLDEGLRKLIVNLEAQTPLEGVGALEVKRFSADIHDSTHDAVSLLRLVRSRFADVMPVEVGVEPAAPQTTLEEGAVLTMALPGRGHVQVRVAQVAEKYVVLATLRGHALAGIVRFATNALERGVRFEVMTCDSAANRLDWIGLTLGGARLQDANWTKVLHNVAKLAGGSATNVTSDARNLGVDEAVHMEAWIAAIGRRDRVEPAELT